MLAAIHSGGRLLGRPSIGAMFKSQAAAKYPYIRQQWVVCWPPPPYPDRPHGPNKRPLAVRLRPKDSNPSRRANSAPNAARGR